MSTLKLNLSYSNSVLNISHSHAINQVNSYVLVFLIKPQLHLNTIATLNFNQHCVRRLENLRFQIHLLKNDLPTLEQGPNCCNNTVSGLCLTYARIFFYTQVSGIRSCCQVAIQVRSVGRGKNMLSEKKKQYLISYAHINPASYPTDQIHRCYESNRRKQTKFNFEL